MKTDLEYILAKPAEKRTQADRDYLEMIVRQIAARAHTDRIQGVTDPQLAGMVAEFVNPQPKEETAEERQARLIRELVGDDR
jgi:hypothetical protein